MKDFFIVGIHLSEFNPHPLMTLLIGITIKGNPVASNQG